MSLVLTREMILALKVSAGDDVALRNACESAMWNLDAKGELHGWHTAQGDLIRAAVMQRARQPQAVANVVVMTRHANGWTEREAQVWNSWVRCIWSHDPFQNGAHTLYPARDIASVITHWRLARKMGE